MIARPGQADFEAVRWRDDDLQEVHNDDALWGFAVRAHEEYRLRDPTQWNDAVLNRLFRMGTLDWASPDHRTHQGTQSIRFATAMGSRLYSRIRGIESQVCDVRFLVFIWLTSLVLSCCQLLRGRRRGSEPLRVSIDTSRTSVQVKGGCETS